MEIFKAVKKETKVEFIQLSEEILQKAIDFTGMIGRIIWIHEDGKYSYEKSEGDRCGIVLFTSDGVPTVIPSGNYIVRDDDGELSFIAEDSFSIKYEVLMTKVESDVTPSVTPSKTPSVTPSKSKPAGKK